MKQEFKDKVIKARDARSEYELQKLKLYNGDGSLDAVMAAKKIVESAERVMRSEMHKRHAQIEKDLKEKYGTK